MTTAETVNRIAELRAALAGQRAALALAYDGQLTGTAAELAGDIAGDIGGILAAARDLAALVAEQPVAS